MEENMSVETVAVKKCISILVPTYNEEENVHFTLY